MKSAYDRFFAIASIWAVSGLFLDGWAHRHRPELESFFTPWHAVLYSGFFAAVIAIVMEWRASGFPSGGLAHRRQTFVGLALVVLGGAADSIWHTALGIETSLDALVSPPHMVLLVGAVLALSSPIRRGWFESATRFGPTEIVSLACSTAVVAFFFQYVSPFSRGAVAAVWETYDPDLAESVHIVGFLAFLIFTVLLVAPLLYLRQRFDLPPGVMTVHFVALAVAMTGLDEFDNWRLMLSVIPAVAVGEITRGMLDSRAKSGQVRGWPVLVIVVLWSGHLLMLDATDEVKWPVELWLGAVVMSGLLAWTLSLIALPPQQGRDGG
ncbi:MAG: hypothetical protein ACI8Y4_004527 [Candidatus Poriferisodalaceae bacterium]|jgi:hypothetical protein